MTEDPKLTAISARLECTSKPLWQSKTFWLQLLSLLAVFLPGVREWIALNPVEPVAALAAINILIRFATSDRVRIFADEKASRELVPEGRSGKSEWIDPVLLVPLCMSLTAIMGGGLLSSCAAVPSFPMRVGLVTEHGAASWSSKDGLRVDAMIRPAGAHPVLPGK